MSSRKHKAVSLEVKKAIIEAGAKNNNQTQLVKQFSIPRGTLQGILKDKQAILQAIEDGGSAKQTKLRAGKH